MPLVSTASPVNIEQAPQSWSDKLKEGYAELKAEGTVAGPTIVYSSRTHSQLAQVMKELRNTSYRCGVTLSFVQSVVLQAQFVILIVWLLRACSNSDIRRFAGPAVLSLAQETRCACTPLCPLWLVLLPTKHADPSCRPDPADGEQCALLSHA